MSDVACVGILCADVLVKPVDELPEKGKLKLVEHLELAIGGCAANAAVDLARLGISTSLIGKIGSDGFGRYLASRLDDEGVDIQFLSVDPEIPTSASIVTIDGCGERSVLHCSGTNAVFRFEDINLKEVFNAKILFIAGTFLMRQFDGNGAEQLLKEAQKAGVVCCCDTAWDSTGQWMSIIENMLPHIDWFIPSYDEATQLSGETRPESISAFFREKGVRNVVIKLGEKGCYVRVGNEDGFYVNAHTNVPVVDTSGAGDSFCAGFIAGLLLGFEPKKCARLANAAGALCVMQMGTTSGIKNMQETVQFMEERNHDV